MYIYQNGEGKVIGLITVLLALRDQRPEPTKKNINYFEETFDGRQEK